MSLRQARIWTTLRRACGRGWLVGTLVAVGALGALPAVAQQLGEHMVREGTVGIANDVERRLFTSLICTCGCPRESLATCTCDVAARRRDVLRVELEKGTTFEDIQAGYAALYGPQALAWPPNSGAHRMVWLLPLGALIVSAGAVGVALRRWQRKGASAPAPTPSRAETSTANPTKRDAYDDKLDDELRDLDDDA
jgi:cytochrome c-type biogenesis protein CcmH/NrfF